MADQTKQHPFLAAIWISPEKLGENPRSFIPGSEVAITFRCGRCAKTFTDIVEGVLIVDLDLSQLPTRYLGEGYGKDYAPREGHVHLYEVPSVIELVHRECDDGKTPGLRISAWAWASSNGRIGIRPKFQAKNTVH